MRLMIVGTLEGYITAAGKIAMQRGAKVSHTDSIEGALNALRSAAGADLVMIDVKLDVARFVESLKAERITLPVVACGIGTDASAAVRAIRAGAKEYIPLPPDAELIGAVLAAVAEESHAIVSQDPAMQAVLRLADQIAPSDASVFITGESGTGKELMARYIHRKSRRADNAFVAVNCAAIPENLLESELFGHEKGAFTGAVARRIGKFEEANGGTLLLDELSEMHPRLQAKLLRAIQEREIDRIGSTQPIKINVRLIATSNRDLEAEVKAGNFREDLFFRLNVMSIPLPSLRDRPADIPLIAEHFIRKYAEANGLGERRLSAEAMGMLMTHHWRGNVRELENTMHRAVLLARGEVVGPEAIMLSGAALAPDAGMRASIPSHSPVAQPFAHPGGTVPAAPRGYPQSQGYGQPQGYPPQGYGQPQGYAPAPPPPQPASAVPVAPNGQGVLSALVGRTVADVERDLILETLTHCVGNRTHAANILGISIRTLRNKLKQYSEEGVPVPPPGADERAAYSP
ncbi:sigma-54-dependent Fis family transcriptional regulator [Azospirillum sp. RWY-5-1]|uniref:Sigma-54-dependent Fis family transcriptional regulator n=1 Tax=Azospirillum oleiclasticum TaxID=2735135 RepID=A0ABX2TC29_9PROT|nr:sigma-54 dependent transcriptional regulator [Azospirillum oleiclasticum]NYZ15224.1 sigma-54-dependent Fis family transcriptional regulator [Azospirillum oleiclasticum]NYZ21355.1 sigma-54-dependent Fis family transcriptional regulator [Azospirillum oleiclasticum]